MLRENWINVSSTELFEKNKRLRLMLEEVFRVSAMELKSRLDLTEIFCDVDDFDQCFEKYCRSIPQLTAIALRSFIENAIA